MKNFLKPSAVFVLLAICLSGCVWYGGGRGYYGHPYAGGGYGYGHPYYGGGGGWNHH